MYRSVAEIVHPEDSCISFLPKRRYVSIIQHCVCSEKNRKYATQFYVLLVRFEFLSVYALRVGFKKTNGSSQDLL
jgi:hypothetical protein